MNLLPVSPDEFESAKYWDRFFKERGNKTFEWYGEYEELCGILHKYIKVNDDCLIVGCGNSKLSSQMYDVGFRKTLSIDINNYVINQMKTQNMKTRPDLKFEEMDIMDLKLADSSFNVVLDKGTFDAMMPNDETEVIAKVDKMFSEISRVLKFGGRYVCISLLQRHILLKCISFFSSLKWPIRICRIDQSNEFGDKCQLQPFAIIATKFKSLPNMTQIYEMSNSEDQVKRLPNEEDLIESVKSIQYYSLVKHHLSKNDTDEIVHLTFYSNESMYPRYLFNVIDTGIQTLNKFAVFIVPLGKELEWLYSSPEGQKALANKINFQRVIIVLLHPGHTYHDLDQVKNELSPKVSDLQPSNMGKFHAPFLSEGDDIHKSKIIFKGMSMLGEIMVKDDISNDQQSYRRLILLKDHLVIHSQVKLANKHIEKSKKKKGNKQMVVDQNHLCSDVHKKVLTFFNYVKFSCKNTETDLMMIGSDAFCLALFLNKSLPDVYKECIITDSIIRNAAKNLFGLESNNNLVLHCEEMLTCDFQASERLFDCVILLLDDFLNSNYCNASLLDTIFPNLFSSLKNNGLLVLYSNIDKLEENIENRIKGAFSNVYQLANENIFCIFKSIDSINLMKTNSTEFEGNLYKHLQEFLPRSMDAISTSELFNKMCLIK